MRERPILFSAPMVRAILDGRKTQTRRAVKGLMLDPTTWAPIEGAPGWFRASGPHPFDAQDILCPYGAPGDRLYVRETWQLHERFTDVCRVVYAASAGGSWTEMHADFPADLAGKLVARPFQEGWRPSIHMPRWSSRITLEIAEVRVERLKDISTDDVLAEGAPVDHSHRDTTQDGSNPVMCLTENSWTTQSPHAWFHRLWDQINGPGSWDLNPWVWVVQFRRSADEARAS